LLEFYYKYLYHILSCSGLSQFKFFNIITMIPMKIMPKSLRNPGAYSKLGLPKGIFHDISESKNMKNRDTRFEMVKLCGFSYP